MYLLRVKRDDLSRADLSDCVLSHADFSGGRFEEFSKPCSLAEANFSRAYLSGIRLSTYSFSNIMLSPDEKYILVGGGGGGVVGGVSIPDASDFSLVKEIKTEYRVSHVTYSPDEKYIVVVGGGGAVVVGGVTILDAESFEIVKEIVRVANDVKGMKIDGAIGLDPVLEEALRRAI